MTTFVKVSLPAEQFALADTFEAVPNVTFEAVRLVSQDADEVLPLLWATSAESPTVYEALNADRTTTDVQLLSRRDHDSLFRMNWTDEVQYIRNALVDDGGGIMSAHGTDGKWAFWILFPARDAVSSTYDACDVYDVSIEKIRSLAEMPSLGNLHLTEKQFETIDTAVDSGYYSVPRDVTIEDLATELGVSHQALSERLRRGHRALVEFVIRA